jgi:hypothetical protein
LLLLNRKVRRRTTWRLKAHGSLALSVDAAVNNPSLLQQY